MKLYRGPQRIDTALTTDFTHSTWAGHVSSGLFSEGFFKASMSDVYSGFDYILNDWHFGEVLWGRFDMWDIDRQAEIWNVVD